MNKKSKKLFEQREAVQYLVEDSQLACIELDMKLRRYQKFFSLPEDFAGIRSEANPSLVFAYICEELHKKHLVEMEYMRERTNLNYFMQKAKVLWQKK